MTLRKCLLITDDPDDHQTIAEAISQICEEMIVLNIIDSQKALMLLHEGKCLPDYVFLDLSMQGIRINTLLRSLNSDELFKMPILAYGDLKSFNQIGNTRNVIFFNKDYEYSQLLDFLKNVFRKEILWAAQAFPETRLP